MFKAQIAVDTHGPFVKQTFIPCACAALLSDLEFFYLNISG